MSADTRTHDDVLNLMPAPVAVVGVRDGDRRGGLTVAWLSRVATDPPLLMISVSPDRHSHELLAAAEEFTVSLPVAGQLDEARLFGMHSQRDRDKWSETDHVLLGDRTPALARCAARFLCRSAGRFPAGDHDCFLGEIVESEWVDGPPALPMRGADYRP